MIFGSQSRSKYIISRGIALFLSVFIILSIIGGIFFPGFDAIRWILHINFVPEIFLLIFLGFLGVFLISFAINPKMQHSRKVSLTIALFCFIILLSINSVEYYIYLLQNKINTTFPIPFTIFMLAVIFLLTMRIRGIKVEKENQIPEVSKSILRKLLFFIDFMPFHLHINLFTSSKTDRQIKKITKSIVSEPNSLLRPQNKGDKLLTVFFILIIFVLSAFLFTLGQMFCYGKTNYSRKVDAVVVFGAGVYADGTMSLVLEDRIRSACEAFKVIDAKYLICSGGPGPGKISEAQAMKKFAIKQGIVANRILIDDLGLNTFETVKNLKHISTKKEIESVLAISHFYHLTRIKLTCEVADITAYTAPATQTLTPSGLPFFVVREVFALWFYFFKTMVKPL